MKKIAITSLAACCIAAFLAYYIEYAKLAPGNLTVFVINDPSRIPKEFYSSPHANALLVQGIPLARLPLSNARELGIQMAEASKRDFSCWHNYLTWTLIEYGAWPNYCRWNNKGEWQNSEWPQWIEKILRSLSPDRW